MPHVTGAFSYLLAPGLRKVFFQHYKDREKEYTKVVKVLSSSRNYEEVLEVAGLPSMPPKVEGKGIVYQNFIQGGIKRFTWVTYGLGFRVTEEMMEDDLYNIMNRNGRALKKSAMNAVEVNVFNLYNNAFTTEYGFPKNGVNQALISTSHTLIGGGSAGNRPATDADISFGALEAAILHFNTLNDERGMPIDLEPAKLLFHPNDLFLVQELLGSDYKPFTGNNEINPLKGRLTPIWSRYLTDPDAWFVIASLDDEDGPVMYWRRQLRFQNGDDFDSGDAKFKATQRFGYGCAEWRYLYGSTGAA